MKEIFLIFALMLLCSCSNHSEKKHCFVAEKNGVQTIVVLREATTNTNTATTNGQITVYEKKDGLDLFPPQATLGTLTQSEFKYADGTVFKFDSEKLSLPTNRLFNGEVFPRVACQNW